MSPQADYIVANGTGAAVRSDINGQLAAIVSNNSGATEPATMYAYQWWADTTTGLLKLRNSANSAWISLRELDGTLTIEDGTAAAPGLAFTSDLNTGLLRVGADQLAISTGGTSRLAVSTTAVSSTLAVDVPLGAVGTPSITFTGDLNTGLFSPGADTVALVTGGTNRVHISSGGLVGIGTTAPSEFLTVNNSASSAAIAVRTGGAALNAVVKFNADDANYAGIGLENTALVMRCSNSSTPTERARIDSSGRLLIGTSSAPNLNTVAAPRYPKSIIYNTTDNDDRYSLSLYAGTTGVEGPQLLLAKNKANSTTSTLVASGDEAGVIAFAACDGAAPGAIVAARIAAFVDGTPGANDMPGRLVFSTTADGASSPTERLRIRQDGATVFYNTSLVFPNTDNAVQLGGASNRMTALFAVNGTIQTSDRREKTAVTDSQLGSDFIKALRPISYKWIEGGNQATGECDEDGNYVYESVPGQRTHWGFIAQEVKEVVDSAGVDFGGWVLTDKDDPDSQQALRYDQFIAPLTKALQEALAKIETLEAKVAALEGA